MNLTRGILSVALVVGLSLLAVEHAQACSCVEGSFGPGHTDFRTRWDTSGAANGIDH